MHRVRKLASLFARDQRGTTAIEYGLIALLMAVGMLAGLQALGSGNTSSWGATAGKISTAMQGK
jgi:pilus assembly protein Flp/PilA